MRLHVAVGHGAPGWFHDEVHLPDAFAAHGIEATPLHWRDIPADGSPVLIRTAWDYSQDRDGFLAWLDALEDAGSQVVNDPATMRWNLDKRYMLELEAAGHAIVPTKVVDTLGDVVGHWDEAVAKPVVGGGAEGLHLVDGEDVCLVPVPGNRWGEARATGPWLVQPRLALADHERHRLGLAPPRGGQLLLQPLRLALSQRRGLGELPPQPRELRLRLGRQRRRRRRRPAPPVAAAS